MRDYIAEVCVFFEREIRDGKTGHKNSISTFNRLRKFADINNKNLLDCFLNEVSYERLKRDYSNYLRDQNRPQPTIDSNRSRLDSIQQIVQIVTSENYNSNPPPDIKNLRMDEALTQLGRWKWGTEISKHSVGKKIAKHCDLNEKLLQSWLYRSSPPAPDKVPLVCQIARFFGIAEELLTKKLALPAARPSKRKDQSLPARPSKRLTSCSLSTFPEQLQRQLDCYVMFKTKSVLPDLSESYPELAEKRRVHGLLGGSKWTINSCGNIETATTFLSSCKNYFGYLHYHCGVPLDNLDLGLVMDIHFLQKYVNFRIKREVYSSTIDFLKYLNEGVHFHHGYFSRYHALISKFQTPQQWQEECELLKFNLKGFINELDNLHEKWCGKRNVQFLMDMGMEKAEEALHQMINTLNNSSHYANPDAPNSFYFSKMAATFLAMMEECPLRRKNWCELRLLTTSSESISRLQDCAIWHEPDEKKYQIFIPKQALKNRNSVRVGNVNYRFSQRVSDQIHDFLIVRAKALMLVNRVTHYFFASLNGDYSLQNAAFCTVISRQTLSAIRYLWPKLEVGIGINLHGMRHLAASLFLSKFKGQYDLLATLLQDDLNTVIKVYAKVNHPDNYQSISTHFDNRGFTFDQKGGVE